MIKILFLLLPFTQDCRSNYLDRVLESKNLAQYFLVVKVNINNKVNDILVLNYDLYKLMKSKDTVLSHTENYKSFIKNKIEQREPINITPAEMSQMKALVIMDNKIVRRAAARGRKKLFNKYLYVSEKYNYARLNPHIKQSERVAVVKMLFEWNFFIETVEGDFSVPELNFCGGI